MPNYRRYYIENSPVFITCVTKNRYPFLEGEKNLTVFWDTAVTVNKIYPFDLLAYVLLPDHFHLILQCKNQEVNFSQILHSLKRNFTINYKRAFEINHAIKIWQDRFWDHVIRDEKDLKIHLDYIHWNPVKHGLVTEPEMWKQTSFHDWIDKGLYEQGSFRIVPNEINNISFE
jgi:putative transposase